MSPRVYESTMLSRAYTHTHKHTLCVCCHMTNDVTVFLYAKNHTLCMVRRYQTNTQLNHLPHSEADKVYSDGGRVDFASCFRLQVASMLWCTYRGGGSSDHHIPGCTFFRYINIVVRWRPPVGHRLNCNLIVRPNFIYIYVLGWGFVHRQMVNKTLLLECGSSDRDAVPRPPDTCHRIDLPNNK